MGYGIPYMGSKSDICASIALNFPAAENFYDMFGGGFSMTHYMIQNKSHRFKNFHYNEIKSDVVELIKKSINGDFNYEKFKPEWIGKEDFFLRKDTDALVRCLWSFGNNQRTYLFSEEIELYKKSLHMAVVFDEFNSTAKSILKLTAWPKEISTIRQRRLYLRQRVAFDKRGLKKGELEQLQQLQQLEQLQRFQQLKQLERLELLELLENVTFSALSYEHVQIKPNSVVYCDIPYKGTANYISEFNHQIFFDWAAALPFPVYISEYNVSDPRFKLVYSLGKGVKLSRAGMTKSSSDNEREKLYWNGVLIK